MSVRGKISPDVFILKSLDLSVLFCYNLGIDYRGWFRCRIDSVLVLHIEVRVTIGSDVSGIHVNSVF